MSADENTTITMTGLYGDDFQSGGQADMQGSFTTGFATEVTGGNSYYSYADSTRIHISSPGETSFFAPTAHSSTWSIFNMSIWREAGQVETDLIVGFNRGGIYGSNYVTVVPAADVPSGQWVDLNIPFPGITDASGVTHFEVDDIGITQVKAGDVTDPETLSVPLIFSGLGPTPVPSTIYIDNVSFSDKVAAGQDDIVSIGFDEFAMSLLTIEPLEGQDQYLNAEAVSNEITASSPTGDQALRVTKADGAPTDSGIVTTVAGGGQISLLDEYHSQVTMDVYAPGAGEVIRLRLEEAGDPTKFIVAEGFTTQAGWQNLRIDFARQVDGNFDPTANYNQLTVYPGYGHTGSDQTYYFDNVNFRDGVTPEPPGPTTTLAVSFLYVGGGNRYFIDGVQQDSLELVPGNTYVFDYSAASGHPLGLSTNPEGPELSSEDYNYTVDLSAKTTTIVVDNFTPPLYYYCKLHSGMGGSAEIASPLSLGQSAVALDLDENGDAVYSAVASDGTGTNLQYELTGPDADLFDITSDGAVTFKQAPDYESDPIAYNFSVRASDGVWTDLQAVSVSIQNVAEPSPPPEPVYTPGPVLTNPNPEPGDDPASVTLYISDQDPIHYYMLGEDGESYIKVTGPGGAAVDADTTMADLRVEGVVLFPLAVAPPVYTPIYTFDNPNPEPGDDPASVTLYNSDQDYNVYILGQDGASYIQVTVPSVEGIIDFATIGMVDLKGMDGTVLFPLAVAPPVYTPIYTFDNPNPEPGDDPASVTLYNSDQDYNVYILGQDGASYIQVTVPSVEGIIDFATIGMVDLKGMDGTVLFPSAVAPPVYTPGPVITNPNPEPGDDPASVTLFTSDQVGDTNSYLQAPDPEAEVGEDSVIYIPVTGANGEAATGATPMDELQTAGPEGEVIVLFPGAVAPEPVYTAGPVLTNPNPEPGDEPASVTLYTSDLDSNTYILGQDGVTYIQVTGPGGAAVNEFTTMSDLAGMDGEVLFPGAVAPPVYTAGPVITNPNPAPVTESDGPASVTLYTSDQDSNTYILGQDGLSYIQVTGPGGAAVNEFTTMAELEAMDGTFMFPGAVAPPVYTQLAVLTNPNPEPGGDPASVTLYESDQDGNTYILLQDGVSYIQVTVPEGVDVATIGMVDLTADGVVLFPGAVAPPVYTAGSVITNPNTDPLDELPDTVTLYTSDQVGDTNSYLQAPDPEGEVGDVIYVPVTDATGAPATGTTPMDELRIAAPDGQPIVLFPGAVAPPVYTAGSVITNPNPEPGDDPSSVTLYTSDQVGDTNSYLQAPDPEGEVGDVIYVPVTDATGAPATGTTPMDELRIAAPDGQPIVLFPGAVAPPVYTAGSVITNPNTDPLDELPDTVTLYTSDQVGDTNSYLQAPDPEGEVGDVIYVPVTDATGAPATGTTPMDELRIAAPDGQPIVLFPGAVAPPVYTAGSVITNPNPEPGDDPSSVTLYTSDQVGDTNSYLQAPDPEGEVGDVIYVPVTDATGAPATGTTPMDELRIAAPDGQPIVLFPGAVAPPVYTAGSVITNPNPEPGDDPSSVTLYTSDQVGDTNSYLQAPDPEGEVGDVIYVPVTDATGAPATGTTPMDELRIAAPDGQPIVLFPGAVAPPVYTAGSVITNPNPEPGDDPSSVTLYTSDQVGDTNSYLQAPDPEGEVGDVIYVPVTDATGAPATGTTPMDELRIAAPDGQPIVLFPGAVAPPVYTAGSVITNPNTDPLDELPDTVTLYTSDQVGDTNSYLQAPDPEGEVGDVIYVPVTDATGAPATGTTPMDELRIAAPDGQPIVLFPGAVAPPVYTAGSVITNPNPEPGDDPSSVTLYTSDQVGDTNSYLQAPDPEGEVGDVIYVPVTDATGAPATGTTPMDELRIAAPDGQPIVLFPGAVAPPVYTAGSVITNPNTDPLDELPDTVTLYTSDQVGDTNSYLQAPDPEGEVGDVIYVPVTDATGAPATGTTPMDELRIAAPDGQPIVLFPGAVAPPVYTAGSVITNPNPEPGDDPSSVTLYTSDQVGDTNSYLQAPDPEGEVGDVIYVPVTDATGAPATGTTPMDELRIAAPDGQPIVLFPGAVAPPVYTAGSVITNPNTDPLDELPDTVTLYTSDQVGDTNSYLQAPDPEGEVGDVIYVPVTDATGAPATGTTPMDELRIAAPDGQPIVLFPGAVAPPVYTAGSVITNPNPEPGDDPSSVTLYTSDQVGDTNSYLQAPDPEGEVGDVIYVPVTDATGAPATGTTPMDELRIAAPDGQPIVLFPGAVAPPVYTAGSVITNPNPEPGDDPSSVTLYTSDQVGDTNSYLQAPDPEGEVGDVIYVPVTDATGAPATGTTPMDELRIAAPDGQPIVLFPGAVAPPVNDFAPDFSHDVVFLQQNENIDTTQVIWNASATDADGNDVTYSLGGSDGDKFRIDQTTGAVRFAESPDYESGVTSYDFTITASDGSLTDQQEVTVQINNVVEQYTLDATDLGSGGEFVGEAMDDRMDGRGASSALELSGGAGTDVLYGGDAGDILDGGDGNDQLSGGGGDDVLIAGTGVDRIDGGDGIDTVVLNSEDGDFVSVNLAREWQYSGDGWNQIVNVENVVTGGGADIIKGNDIGNVVESGAGNDWVYANGGDDVLIGGEGIDRLFGGDGNDTVLYETDDNLVIDLSSEWQLGNDGTDQGIDKLIGIENVTTGSGSDVLIGNAGDNVLTGGDGDDTLTGGDGADVFRFYSSEGTSTDTITDFGAGDSIELIDDTTGAVAQAQITTDANGSTVTWDDLTIVLDVTVNYDDINPITD